MSGMPSPLKSPIATIGGASARLLFGSGIGTFRNPVPPLIGHSVAVPGRENAFPVAAFVREKETVPEGGAGPFGPYARR